MTKFTPEEISLCKQVAEKHKKDLFFGDWFLQYDDFGNEVIDISHGESMKKIEEFGLVPLWSISDCLEFLREKYFFESMLLQLIWDGWNYIISKKPTHKEQSFQFSAKTPLEACLKAILAVLEEEK